MESWQKEELLQVYLQGRLFLHLSLTEQESRRMEQIFALLWEVVHDRPFPKESVQKLDFSRLSPNGQFQRTRVGG